MKNVIVSANYLNRKDKKTPWLLRPETEEVLENAMRATSILAHGVKFQASSLESGFGCGTVAFCGSAEAVNFITEENIVKGKVKLFFNGLFFENIETNKKVVECKYLLLLPDGSMFSAEEVLKPELVA